MKKILFASIVLLGLQSCIISEEYQVTDRDSYSRQITYDLHDMKPILPEDLTRDFTSELEELSYHLKKGVKISELEGHLQKQTFNPEFISYFKENQSLVYKYKDIVITFDVDQLIYHVDYGAHSDVKNKELLDFLNGIIYLTELPLGNENMVKEVVTDSKQITVHFDGKAIEKFSNQLYQSFNEMTTPEGFQSLINYQLTIKTPKKIKTSSINGNYFSLDGQSVTYNFKLSEIISGKVSEVKLAY